MAIEDAVALAYENVDLPEMARHRKLIFVTGKGGIGKSLVTAALGQAAEAQGRNVLLVESAHQGQIAPLFGQASHLHEEVQVSEGIRTLNLDSSQNFRDYVVKYLGRKRLYETVFDHKVVRTFIDTIPGLAEITMLGRLFYEAELAPEPRPDLIIFDGAASGHFLSLMTTPDAIIASGIGGPLVKETRRVREFLTDESTSGSVYVTVPEPLIVSECLDFLPQLEEKSPVRLDGVVVNRCIAEPEGVQTASNRPIFRYLRHQGARRRSALHELRAGLAASPSLGRFPVWQLPEVGFVEEPLPGGFASWFLEGRRSEVPSVGSGSSGGGDSKP